MQNGRQWAAAKKGILFVDWCCSVLIWIALYSRKSKAHPKMYGWLHMAPPARQSHTKWRISVVWFATRSPEERPNTLWSMFRMKIESETLQSPKSWKDWNQNTCQPEWNFWLRGYHHTAKEHTVESQVRLRKWSRSSIPNLKPWNTGWNAVEIFGAARKDCFGSLTIQFL